MSNSLKDALLQAGVKAPPKPVKPVSEKPWQDNKPAVKHAPPHAAKRDSAASDLARAYAARAQAEKAEAERLRREQEEAARLKRERKQKIEALLRDKALNDPNAEFARNFQHGARIRRIYVNAEQLRRLNAGELAVTQIAGRYLLVEAEIGRAAAAIEPAALVLLVDPNALEGEEGYSDPRFQVPDDLVW